MQPVNSKSLLHFIFDQMDKLDKGEKQIEEVKAQALLAKQANNILKYELDRVKIEMQLSEHNQNQNFKKIEIRNLESKPFD